MSKIVLITGASSGIGRATALELLRAGHTVYGGARRVESLDAVSAAGGHPLAMDVTKDANLERAVPTVLDQQGRIDVLVNNAGFGLYGAAEDVPLDQARYQLEVNLFGPDPARPSLPAPATLGHDRQRLLHGRRDHLPPRRLAPLDAPLPHGGDDLRITSRLPTGQRVMLRAVLTGQVGCPVRLVTSRLAGRAWWNDRQNDHLSSDPWLVKALDPACRLALRNAPETDGGHPDQ